MSLVLIGIDCGVKTGFACTVEGALVAVDTVTIVEAMDEVLRRADGLSGVRLYIEDARLRTWIPAEKNIKARVGRAKGAGSVCRDAQIWEEFCKHHCLSYELVAPKHNKTKTDSAVFKQVTGWDERTSEHGRDAAMLIFGRKH